MTTDKLCRSNRHTRVVSTVVSPSPSASTRLSPRFPKKFGSKPSDVSQQVHLNRPGIALRSCTLRNQT